VFNCTTIFSFLLIYFFLLFSSFEHDISFIELLSLSLSLFAKLSSPSIFVVSPLPFFIIFNYSYYLLMAYNFCIISLKETKYSGFNSRFFLLGFIFPSSRIVSVKSKSYKLYLYQPIFSIKHKASEISFLWCYFSLLVVC